MYFRYICNSLYTPGYNECTSPLTVFLFCLCVCDFRHSRKTNTGAQTWGCFSITFVFIQTLLIVISSCTREASAEGQKWVCFSIGVILSALVYYRHCRPSIAVGQFHWAATPIPVFVLLDHYTLSTETNLVYWFSFSRARLVSWWGCHILVARGGFLSPPFLKRC